MARSKDTGGALAVTLAALATMDLEPLKSEWLRLYRSPPPHKLSRDLLARGIAYRLQEIAFGSLKPAVKRQLAEVTESTPPQLGSRGAGTPGVGSRGVGSRGGGTRPPPALLPGATLVRSWGGQTHTIQVLHDHGFAYAGQRYRSLSHIARLITGTHWSGPRFFGLADPASPGQTDAPLR